MFGFEDDALVDDVRADRVVAVVVGLVRVLRRPDGTLALPADEVLLVVGVRQPVGGGGGGGAGHRRPTLQHGDRVRVAEVLLVHEHFVVVRAAGQLEAGRLPPVLERQRPDHQVAADRSVLLRTKKMHSLVLLHLPVDLRPWI